MMLLMENVCGRAGRRIEGRRAKASLRILEESEFSRYRMRRGFQTEEKHVHSQGYGEILCSKNSRWLVISRTESSSRA